ncbi:MAG: VCBS repeat-containing protein [Myxococcales bacterium]|nr:VCBS repeat-containing protein [Myxococcales bacterium]
MKDKMTGKLLSSTRLRGLSGLVSAGAAVLALVAFPGCHEDNPEVPTDVADDIDDEDGIDGPGDASDGSDDVDGGSDATEAGDGIDVVEPPTMACEVRLAGGASAFGPPTSFSLTDADEPTDYAASPGLQVDFSALTDNVPNGTAARLTFDGTRKETLTLTALADGSGLVVFPNVTLGAATVVNIELTVGDQILACEPTTFAVDSSKCDITVTPAAGCLAEDADPNTAGTQVAFTVANPDGRCDEGQIIYRLGGEETTLGAIPLVGGAATFTFTVDPGVSDGVPFEVKGAVASQTNVQRRIETEYAAYTSDARAPELQIALPAADTVVSAAFDEDGDLANGIQLAVTGTATGFEPSSGTIEIEDSLSGQKVVATVTGAAEPYSWKAVLDYVDGVTDTVISATVTDGCGNTGVASVAGIDVLLGAPPALVIVSPADLARLTGDLDGDPATTQSYETTFTVGVTSGSVGATLTVECRDGLDSAAIFVPVGSATVDAANTTLTIPVVIPVGADQTKFCRVVDSSPEPAPPVGVALTVVLPAPVLVVVQPAEGALLGGGGGATLPASVGVSNADFALEYTVSGPGGDAYTATTGAPASGIVAFDLVFTTDGDVASAALPDGAYTVTFSPIGSDDDYVCSVAGSDCTVTVTIDRTAPVLAIAAPDQDVLTPPGDADSDTTQPGFQTDVVASVTGSANEAGTEVCLTLGGQAIACATVADGASSVAFPDVTLQPGDNVFGLTGVDVAGNAAAAVTRTVNLVSNAPAVVVVVPAQDSSTVDPTVTIEVTVADAQGAPATGVVALSVALDGGDFAAVVAEDLGGGRFRFPVALGAVGSHSVVVLATVDGGIPGFSAPRTIVVKSGPPAVAITSPTEGQVLNLASPECEALPGACLYDVTCAGTEVDDGSEATLSVDCGAGTATFAGTMTGGVAAFSDVSLADGASCSLVCGVVDLGTQLTAQSTAVTVRVDRTAPIVGPFTKPAASVLVVYDDESADPGFQYGVIAQAEGLATGDTVSLASDAGAAGSVTLSADIPAGAPAPVDFGSFTLAEGFVTFTLTATDSAGNAATFSETFRVDLVPGPATLTFDAPIAGSVLPSKDDADTATLAVFETTFTIGVSRGTIGSTVTVACRDLGTLSAHAPVGTATVAVADGPLTVNVAIPVGAQPLQECRVSDDAAKPATAQLATFTVALPAPAFVLGTPVAAGLTRETTVSYSAATQNLNTRSGTLTLTGPGGIVYTLPVGPVAANALSGDLHLTVDGSAGGAVVADGVYTVSFDVVDALGNVACEQPGAVCSDSFRFDASVPTATITAPAALLTPPGDADVNTAVPGYQTDVTVTVADGGFEAGATVCLTVGANDVGCGAVADGATTVTFSSVTLQPGDNTLLATVVDVAGNAGVDATGAVTLVSDAPQVAIVVPAQNTSTATDTVTVTVEVRDNQGVLATTGVAVTLLVNGVASPATSTDLGGGLYQLTVTLPTFGVNDLTARATINNGIEGFSAPRLVNYKQNAPAMTVTSPADGAVLNLASAACDVAPGNCLTTVECTGSDLDDGSTSSLTVTCGVGAPAIFSSTVTGGVTTFNGVTLTNKTTCSLVCSATDAGTTQVATSPAASVRVDRTPPAIANFVKPSSGTLIFVDDTSTDPGFQFVVQGRVSGVEAGQDVTVTATWATGSDSKTVTLAAGTIDGVNQLVTFGEMTLPQGAVTFTMTVSDSAGNPAAPKVQAVQIVSEQPLLRISTPTYIQPKACVADSDCPGPGACYETGTGKKCALGWNAATNTSLLLRSVNVATLSPNQFRVCSDNPAYDANPACTASGAGFNVVQTFDVTLPDSNVNIASTIVDGVHTLVGEARLDEAGANWISTVSASVVADQTRLVIVDRTIPQNAGTTLPDDTLAPIGCLNAAEGGGVYDITTTCDEEGVVRLLVNSVQVNSAPAVAGQAVTFANESLAGGPLTIATVCVDLAGNASSASTVAIAVDSVLPTLSFSKPAASPILAGGDRDIVVSSDEVGGTVSLTDNGGAAVQALVSASEEATFDHATFGILADGNHQLVASVTDACGNTTTANNIALVVDTAAPTVAITAPADGSALIDADDASAAGGFQVSLAFGTTGDAATYKVLLETNCASGFTGCEGPSQVQAGAIQNPGGAESPLLLTLPIQKTPDFVRVTVEVTDAAGNKSTDTVELTVTLVACSLSVEGVPLTGNVGNALCPVAGTDCASVELNLDVALIGACAGVTTVSLEIDGSVVDTQPVLLAGATFTRVFAHGSTPSVEVTGSGLQSVSSGAQVVTVDLQDPVPTFTATTVGGFATPASGSTVVWNKLNDLGGAAGIQVNLRLDVTDGGAGGGELSSLKIGATSYGGTPTFPIAVTGTTFGTNVLSVTLPDGASQEVVLTAQDEVGNTATTSFTYSSDVVPPSALTLALSELNPRRPAAKLSWSAVADNGATGAAAAGIDIRYGVAPITDANFELACSAAELVRSAALPTPAAPGTAESYVVTGPDSRDPANPCKFLPRVDGGMYYFAARAIDAFGNVGAIAAGSVVSTDQLRFNVAKVGVARVEGAPLCTGTAPTCHLDFDRRISRIGDVNNDGFDDFAVGGNASFGFCIHYGAGTVGADIRVPADQAVTPGSGANWQCHLALTGTTDTNRAGHYAQNARDLNGDGLQDIAVPAFVGATIGTGDPEIRLYFGVNGGQISTVPDVVIKGWANAEGSSTTRWSVGGDFNGDGRGDIVIGSKVGNVSGTADDNKVYVIPGNATWAKVLGVSLVIDMTNPASLTANNVQTWQMPVGTTNPAFGAQVGFVGNVLDDAGATQYDDVVGFAMDSTAPSAQTKAVVIKGRPTPAAASFTLSYLSNGTGNDDANTVVLRPDLPTQKDFGTNPSVLRRDVSGDGIPDILITHSVTVNPGLRVLYAFDGAKVRGAAGGSSVLMAMPLDGNQVITSPKLGDSIFKSPNGSGYVWVGNFDFFGNLGNIVDDPNTNVDAIAIGHKNLDDLGKAYIRFNHVDADQGFAYGTFPWADMKLSDPFGGSSFAERDILGVGDHNGDGFDDFAVSTATGYVVLFY